MAKSRCILIVEDEQTLRSSMVRGLAKLPGVVVVDAGTVQDAKRSLVTDPPELVISDLDLPDGSGIEVAAELARLDLRVPIVFVSAYIGRYQHRIPKHQEVEVHEKPVSMEKLRGIVEEKLRLVDADAPISPFGVADYVQLAGMGRHTVVIEVRSTAGHGRLSIKAGELWSAVDAQGEGVEAFQRLVFLKAAQVTCRTLDRGELPARNLVGSAEAMLLDVARTFDEAEHANNSVVALDDGWSDVLDETPKRPPTLRPQEARPARESVRPPRVPRSVYPPPMRTMPPTLPAARFSSRTFDEAFERGVDALLARDFRAAYDAFADAERLNAGDRRVRANLKRLRDMGFS
jgi:DNA-binding response OmpR family regulator